MNIINKLFLRLALLPRGLYDQFGIDSGHLKAILVTKLTIDDRRPNTFHQTRKRKPNQPINAATLGTILVSALLGLAYLLAFSIGSDTITQMTFYFSFFFFMLAASLISDFTSVLIDVRDTYILFPRPVNDRTIVTARILHIFIHICKLILPMSLPGLVYIIMTYGGWGGIVFMLMVLMSTLFTIFFINALYIVILRITTPQKFQAIISYVQVAFAVALYGSYQLMPRVMENFSNISFNASSNPLLFAAPPYWFASGWNVFYSLHGKIHELVSAIISITLPIASLYLVIKYLAPSFNNKLALMSTVSTEANEKIKRHVTNNSYSNWLARLFTNTGAERMGFLFTWKMSGRSRDFRLKVYPSIGYILVYVVIVFFQSDRFSFDNIADEGSKAKLLIVTALYICSYLPIMAINQANFSEKFKASWFFHTMPVEKPGLIVRGSVKASILKFFLPLALITVIAGLLLLGAGVIPNLILGLMNQILLASLVVYSGHQYLPFSMHEGNQRKGGAFIRGLSNLLASGFIGFFHYFIFDNTPVVLICTVLSAIATWLLMDGIQNKKITTVDIE